MEIVSKMADIPKKNKAACRGVKHWKIEDPGKGWAIQVFKDVAYPKTGTIWDYR